MESPWSLVTWPYDIARELVEVAATGLVIPFGRSPTSWIPERQIGAVAEHQVGGHRTPIVLVHGYGGTRSSWSALREQLALDGFATVHEMSYRTVASRVPDVARALVRDCHDVMQRAGSDRVHLVGHSLGGVVVRYAVQRAGLEPHAATAITVAAPHRGTLAALFCPGELAASLRPGSRLLLDLRRGTRESTVRWASFYSDRDLVVPPHSARLEDTALRATNILVPGVGHLGILRAPLFLSSAVRILSDDSALGELLAAGWTGGPRREADVA
jgi:pimeloyl-ACP methyl ester carboxylesterase